MLKRTLTKRILGILIMGVSLLALAGCGSAQPAPAEPTPSPDMAQKSDVASFDAAQTPEAGSTSDAAQTPEAGSTSDAIEVQGVSGKSDDTKESQLCGLAESEEEAKKIAELYGIELVDYSYGLATFHTDEDPQKIIDEGVEKGYPQLTLNGSNQLY